MSCTRLPFELLPLPPNAIRWHTDIIANPLLNSHRSLETPNIVSTGPETGPGGVDSDCGGRAFGHGLGARVAAGRDRVRIGCFGRRHRGRNCGIYGE
eukprot:1132167-Amorphochlora_amoeboformis.AAC.1